MGKKKLVPEYTFSLGKEDDIRQSTIKNIFDKIADSEKASIARINSVRLSNSAANLSFEDVARNFIRKNINDTVTGELSFTRGIRSANHSSGVGGVGYRLFNDEKGDGILEVDSVKVRKTLSTNYLTYDKVNAVGGTIVLSSAWMTVDKVEVYTDRIKCYFKNEGLNVQTWKENDQAKMQRGLDKYLMTVVTDVSQTQDSDGYHWVELYFGDNSEFIDGASIPEVGDVFVQWGSRDDAHPERKNIIIMSVGDSANEYPYIEQYKGVDSFDLTGKLVTRISDDVYFGAGDKSKYIWWNKDGNSQFLLKGTLNQSPSDDTFPSPVYRGAWSNLLIYYKGDVVTHNGTSWICVDNLPAYDVEPPSGGTWAVYSEAGTDGTDGLDGLNTAVVYLYKRSATIPTFDGGVGVTYNFSLKTITDGSIGTWSQTIPSGTNPLYVISAIASSRTNEASILYAEWTSPKILAENGEVGMTVRYSSWKTGINYFAGNLTDSISGNTNPNKYIDYITYVGTDGVMRAYKCLIAHNSTYVTPADSTSIYWEVVSYLPVIASELILANQAVIGGFVFSAAVDASGNVISPSAQYMRTTDSPTTPAIKLSGDGSGHFAKGNIAWDAAGNIDMKGALNAGSIGGFEIADGRIGRQLDLDAAEVPYGMSLYDERIKFSNSEASAYIGTNVNPDTSTTRVVARFINRRSSPSLYYNYGMIVEASGAGYNIAIKSVGDNICTTNVIDYGVRMVNPSINQVVVMSATWPEGFKKVFVRFTATNSSIVLPTIGHVRSRLGISSTTPFAIPITIICSAASTQNGKVRGKSSDIGGLNTSDYPILYDSNGVELNTGIAFGKGDVYQYMLVYDSSTYAAYTINLSN